MPGDPRPIGVFDSGMGGLTVLRALVAELPHERFVYLGDTARLPYGTKSAETVQAYALQATRLLHDQGVKMLVIACNTASAVALYLLQEAWAPIPVIGVIEPGARAGVAATRNRRIAVIATEGTVKGGAYARAIQRLMSEAEVVQQPCQVFVALAEEGWTDSPATHAAARHYLEPPVREPQGAGHAGAGLHSLPRARQRHQGDDRRRRGVGRFGRDHRFGGGRSLGQGRPGRPIAATGRCAFSPPMRRSASPGWVRSSSAARSTPARSSWSISWPRSYPFGGGSLSGSADESSVGSAWSRSGGALVSAATLTSRNRPISQCRPSSKYTARP